LHTKLRFFAALFLCQPSGRLVDFCSILFTVFLRLLSYTPSFFWRACDDGKCRVGGRLKMREMKTRRHTAWHENARNENSGKVVRWFRSAWTVYTATFNFKSSRHRYLMNRNSTPRVAYSCRRTLISIWCRFRGLNRRRHGRALTRIELNWT